MALIEYTKKGLYCPQAKVYIDPWRKVDNALITHGHSDHARWGHKYYVCCTNSVNIIKHRLKNDINIRGLAFGEKLVVNGVTFSFFPAGHIVGSAQIRIEYKGEIWVVSGDYKIEEDGLCTPFEPIKCHSFITECTFGLPIYKWSPQEEVFDKIRKWWHSNASVGKTSIITAYSLGKAQRIIHALGTQIGPIYTHDTIHKMNKVYAASGFSLPETFSLKSKFNTSSLDKALVVTPSSALGSEWAKNLNNYSLAAASGWMMTRKNRKRGGVDMSFVLSDHCDWSGLNEAIKLTGATNIYPTHGNTISFSKWLNEKGYNARPIETEYGELVDDDG